ncbi:uncharacterized protein LOC100906502 [Galendromus occidentalis]|uniref:Uncharacterized protein LOC100906502 n=1 Tax=Galendromus occidentalis TaxID=34638 RepID=A0AAJ6QTM4_9ACAR|nr:uncharacterized protein LOC100906502 [Galendromus occidentalis]
MNTLQVALFAAVAVVSFAQFDGADFSRFAGQHAAGGDSPQFDSSAFGGAEAGAFGAHGAAGAQDFSGFQGFDAQAAFGQQGQGQQFDSSAFGGFGGDVDASQFQ